MQIILYGFFSPKVVSLMIYKDIKLTILLNEMDLDILKKKDKIRFNYKFISQ